MSEPGDETCEPLENPPRFETAEQYADMYKKNGIVNNQARRREEYLEKIKRRRCDFIDQKRNFDELLNDSNESSPEESMEVGSACKRRPRRKKFLRMMLSEWLTEVPEDLEGNWLFKLSPEGQRRLVVACKCNTTAYNKYGAVKSKFQSVLPGGNSTSKGNTFTVLDCIYNFSTGSYYVLDILAWNSYSLIKCSAEFRFFFLKSKLEETDNLERVYDLNKHPFREIPFMTAELPTIEERLSNPFEIANVPIRLDGVLFYYKEMYYHRGITPFVTWLKPYMIPEKLRVPVNESYMKDVPKNYQCLETYLEQVKLLISQGKGDNKLGNQMDCC